MEKQTKTPETKLEIMDNNKSIAKFNYNQEMNPWKVWGIIAIVILCLITFGFFMNYVINDNFSMGYSLGKLYTANTGNIPYIDNSTGVEIYREITLNDYCKELQ